MILRTFSLLFLLISSLYDKETMPKAYKACSGCHGLYGEKNSMVRESKPNLLSEKEIFTLLEGYAQGTVDKYGKSIIMKGFASKLSKSDRKAIASYMVKHRNN